MTLKLFALFFFLFYFSSSSLSIFFFFYQFVSREAENYERLITETLITDFLFAREKQHSLILTINPRGLLGGVEYIEGGKTPGVLYGSLFLSLAIDPWRTGIFSGFTKLPSSLGRSSLPRGLWRTHRGGSSKNRCIRISPSLYRFSGRRMPRGDFSFILRNFVAKFTHNSFRISREI